jgi:predicted O-methyltransferase YrrM
MTQAAPDEQTVARWYQDKDFSCDWTTDRIPLWASLLAARREEQIRVLEIGSWEGRSALFFLNFLPKAQVVCIDTFGGNAEHHSNDYFAALVPASEARFDANVVGAFGGRVEKIKGASGSVLPQLAIEGRRFNVVYVDGSHFAADVYSDAALVWPMVAAGGIVIFDDYTWDLMNCERERPKLGVDAFLDGIKGQFRLLHAEYQLVIERV